MSNNHHIEKETKLNRLVDALARGGYTIHMSFEESQKPEAEQKHAVDRRTLKGIIMNTLNITDAHTVNGWVEYLISEGILSRNPTSDQPVVCNKTRYFINKNKFAHTHLSNY